MIESIEKPQESIRKNRTPTAVIPAQAGIQRRNATGIYRKKQNPTAVIPAKAGIQTTENHRNLSEKTETPTDRHSRKSWNPATEKPQESISKNRNPHRVIPAKAGIQKRNATGIYRKKQKPHRPSFPQKRESRPVGTESYRIKQFP